MANSMLQYLPGNTFIYKIQGATKLLFLILVSVVCMMVYHVWFLLGLVFFSLFLFWCAQIKWQQVAFVVKGTFFFLFVNNIIIFFCFRNYGTQIYNSKTPIPLFFNLLTQEQLFYQFNVLLKYCCIIPLFLIFIITTNPSQLAASLNKLGVSYKISYAFALTIRYIPEIQKDFKNISLNQQARGIKVVKKTHFLARIIADIKRIALIIPPLIFFNLDKIDVITNAMQLRRFGKYKTRTWYYEKSFSILDLFTFLLGLALLLLGVWLLCLYDRFYYPFAQNPF
ncbi:energy-coupling factor transporter transmembrane protein EcfT ['Elaeagnus angustifolia' witches'-broom phytoplasma]|uniref:Energy-coupling factor transporter transmembrane protein EcfT n=1 Tax='Elaeagnus angustifolia' witches'-broom phytoplasma TaxID=1538355 RepID=A0ABS5V8X9_9MOLU|nr:energy-coupling factor transporter transmembrane protein EcfT ['Elaeagnus angustifolia' witches'-broom phytoplasma]MCX2955635.1 energy-coupling factor transporter transmembrane protein EcfT [Candidatus Phytoplasma australiense]